MNDVDDTTRSDRLEVFDEGSSVTAIGVRRVDALSGKIVKLLEVGVHDDLFLISIFERLATRYGALVSCDDRGASLQSANIASKDVHENGLGDIVRIVTCDDFVASQEHGSSVESLSSEDAAKSA